MVWSTAVKLSQRPVRRWEERFNRSDGPAKQVAVSSKIRPIELLSLGMGAFKRRH